jgi:hypothetical protein
MIDKEVIQIAVDKKYTDFSDTVKGELHAKLAGHPDVSAYNNEYDNIQQTKAKFAEINKTPEE